MGTSRLVIGLVIAAAAAATSCSAATSPSDGADAAAALATASSEASGAAAPERAPVVEIADSGDSLADLRDPFVPIAEPPIIDTRRDHHLLDDHAVGELRLIGTVTGSTRPQAMVADPSGRGWVVEPGMRIGRVEVRGSSLAVWRVDRIRAGDVTLVREDGGEGGLPAATRVLSLRQPG